MEADFYGCEMCEVQKSEGPADPKIHREYNCELPQWCWGQTHCWPLYGAGEYSTGQYSKVLYSTEYNNESVVQ